MFEFDKSEIKRSSVDLPSLQFEEATILVNLASEREFAIMLAASKGTGRVVKVNNRDTQVVNCRIIGQTVLEVDLRFCGFDGIKAVH